MYDTPFDGPDGQVQKEKKEDSSSSSSGEETTPTPTQGTCSNSKQTKSTSSMGSKDASIVSAIKKRFDDLAKTMWKPLKKKQDTDWRSKQESSDDDAVIMQISAYTATPPP